jgi:hypothetical protein
MKAHSLIKARGILLFAYAVLSAVVLSIDCFDAASFAYYLFPAILGIVIAVFSGILLFKPDQDGGQYAHTLMLVMVLVCSGFIVNSVAEMLVQKDSFSVSLLIVATLILFAICLAKDPSEHSWHVLNYVAFAFLTFLSGLLALLLLLAIGVLLANLAKDPAAYGLAAVVFFITLVYEGIFLAFSIVSLILTKDQTID